MERGRLALVLSGGGARGAYEAGVVHYLRTGLPEPWRSIPFDLYCGTSVGAVNAAFLAAFADDPREQGVMLRSLWENIDGDRIYRRDWSEVGKFILQTTSSIAGNFLRFNPGKQRNPLARGFVSLFDARPLPGYLKELIPFGNIRRNLAAGHLDGIVLAATNLTYNRTELFLEKRPEVEYHGPYPVYDVPIDPRHVAASASIPFVFPAVQIRECFYSDGGLHLNTPISPAIQLGADRVLVIGMHAPEKAQHPVKDTPPGVGRIAAAIADSIFQDRVTYDMEQLTRINKLIDWGSEVYGSDFLDRINAHLAAGTDREDIAGRGLRRVSALAIQPSRDLSEVFAELLRHNPYLDESFSAFERFAMRLLSLNPVEGRELFSYLVFEPKYTRCLAQLGYEDAAKRRDELIAFLEAPPAVPLGGGPKTEEFA